MTQEQSPQPPPPRVGNYEVELPKYKRPGEPEHYGLSAARLGARPSTVAGLVKVLPGFIQSCVRTTFPEWFLPNRVVLKQQKEGEEEMIRYGGTV